MNIQQAFILSGDYYCNIVCKYCKCRSGEVILRSNKYFFNNFYFLTIACISGENRGDSATCQERFSVFLFFYCFCNDFEGPEKAFCIFQKVTVSTLVLFKLCVAT